MNYNVLSILIILVTVCTSCKDTFMGTDPADTPVSNFEILWNDLDRRYSHFEINNVDWDSVYKRHRPQVNTEPSDEELYNIFKAMMLSLKDGHVNLYNTPFPDFRYDRWAHKPENFDADIIRDHYLSGTQLYQNFTTGVIQDSIGYLHIGSFSGRLSFTQLDPIMKDLKQYSAIVIDVRNNGGGSTLQSDKVVAHFADDRYTYSYARYKNGPGHDQFSHWLSFETQISDNAVYKQPVFVLSNRNCASTTESFILAMRALPRVTIVGDTTAGSSGNPIFRELPNGWLYRFSCWQQADEHKQMFENYGLVPDVPTWISPRDARRNRDTIIDTVLGIIRSES